MSSDRDQRPLDYERPKAPASQSGFVQWLEEYSTLLIGVGVIIVLISRCLWSIESWGK